jgi:tRNA threonylcarbamoyladenosine biosynthesis protein TsaB
VNTGTIVGFDTATQEVAVAVVRDGEPVGESRTPPAEDGMPRHSSVLLGEVERLVGEAGGWESVERIAVGTGPGSYTGLRIGIATARAIAQGLGRDLAPVGTLDAIARGIGEAGGAAADGRERLAVIDARRGQVFALLAGPDGVPRWGPDVLPPEELGERLAGGRAPLAAGSGAVRFRSELEAAGADVLPDSDRAHRLSALHVCLLAEGIRPVRPEEVEPIYLRPPDAERWMLR